jgi:hypothetical protein
VDEGWLNTVRIARDGGCLSSLFPPGITTIWDLPHTLHGAIRLALYFLKFEEIPYEEDRPPRHIWLEPERMERWWKDVKQAQEARYKGEPAERDMTQNEMVAELFPGVKLA